jgi:hypothetical protein
MSMPVRFLVGHSQIWSNTGCHLRSWNRSHQENHRPVCSTCRTQSGLVLDRFGQSLDSFELAAGRRETEQRPVLRCQGIGSNDQAIVVDLCPSRLGADPETTFRGVPAVISVGAHTMKIGLMVVLGLLFAIAPARSQDRSSRFTASGEIQIPSARDLEREVFVSRRGDFPSIDSVADGEMDRMDREIDRLLAHGICDAC